MFLLFFSSAGKQVTHKNPEEYTEPSVEWNADLSWHHSSRHDHQNAQVGAPPLSFTKASHQCSSIPQAANWPLYYAQD